MKRILMLGVLGFGLVGCVSPMDDMLNNKFTSISPTDTSLKGFWSGNNGPYLMTYKFNGDGTGLVCYSYGTANSLEKLKIANGVIYMQDGSKQQIMKSTETDLILKVNYFGSATFRYKPDTKLINASPYCEQSLKQ